MDFGAWHLSFRDLEAHKPALDEAQLKSNHRGKSGLSSHCLKQFLKLPRDLTSASVGLRPGGEKPSKRRKLDDDDGCDEACDSEEEACIVSCSGLHRLSLFPGAIGA